MASGQEEIFDPRLQGPFTMLITGPTSCGKSNLVFEILRNTKTLINPPIDNITYCYGQWQNEYDEFKDTVTFHHGLLSEEELLDATKPTPTEHSLLIIDDIVAKSEIAVVSKFFTQGSHHRNTSVIFISQNLFMKDPNYRVISLNAHYLVVFKNPRDMSQIAVLGRQAFPHNTKFLTAVYNNETTRRHSYILLDFKQATPQHLRVRGSITSPWSTPVYIAKEKPQK